MIIIKTAVHQFTYGTCTTHQFTCNSPIHLQLSELTNSPHYHILQDTKRIQSWISASKYFGSCSLMFILFCNAAWQNVPSTKKKSKNLVTTVKWQPMQSIINRNLYQSITINMDWLIFDDQWRFLWHYRLVSIINSNRWTTVIALDWCRFIRLVSMKLMDGSQWRVASKKRVSRLLSLLPVKLR